ncbi:MAG: AAA family ATPase [Bacteroidota bacterium]|nr:AAA family ATPase [Bacteroidota bacterium]
MLNKYISNIITSTFEHKPLEGQKIVINSISEFIQSNKNDAVFLLKGYAGTGKTSLIGALVKAFKELKLKSVLLAPTGRAAKVLSKYAQKNAFTIHKKIYRKQSSHDGFGKFKLDKNLHTNTLFIIDEASMINSASENSVFGSGNMLDDLIRYVYNGKGCKLLLSGDTAQLPPVHSVLSPALDKNQLEGFGKNVIEHELTEIIRQAKESGILYNATNIRNLLNSLQPHDTLPEFPQIELDNFSDITRVSGRELVEEIDQAYGEHGEKDVTIICRSNKRANRFNQGIRQTVLYREDEITAGDLLMIVKNNYFWAEEIENTEFIANGDIAEIATVKGYEERYGFRFADVRLIFPDFDNAEIDSKILLDTLHSERASLSQADFKKLYHKIAEDYPEINNKRTLFKKIKDNPYFNAMQVKYGYAVTCHKAQGGQWSTVFIDQGWLTKDMINTEFLRWLYTAFTRSTEKLRLVNFSNDFFGGKSPEF